MCEYFRFYVQETLSSPGLSAHHFRRQNLLRKLLCVPAVCTLRPLRDLRSLFEAHVSPLKRRRYSPEAPPLPFT